MSFNGFLRRGYDHKRNKSAESLITAVVMAALIPVLSCSSPTEDPIWTPQYHSPADSAWKVIENLEYAYMFRDIDHYSDCFRDDLEFVFLQEGDTVSWGMDTEMAVHGLMFENVAGIELTLSGTSQSPWAGDSTGLSLQLPRNFDLKIYTDGDQPQGYRASGVAVFVCREDSTGQWYVWKWYDTPGEWGGWGELKAMFLPG